MKKTIIVAAFALTGLFCLPAQATFGFGQTVDLDTVYTGNIPSGTAPWLRATYAYKGFGGKLTLTSLLNGTDFVQGSKNGEAAAGWAFFLSLTNIDTITCDSGNCADDVFFGSGFNANTGPVPGDFNLLFSWSQNDRFDSGDSAIYDIVYGDGAPPLPFLFGENGSGWSSVAHIQGISANDCSGWIVAGSGDPQSSATSCSGGTTPQPVTAVPGPNPAMLFLLTVVSAGMLVTVRRARSTRPDLR